MHGSILNEHHLYNCIRKNSSIINHSSASASTSTSSQAMNSSTHPRPTTQSTKLKPSTSKWFLHELLQRTDTSNGDICLFHYPMATPQVPYISIREMQLALEELVSLSTTRSDSDTEWNVPLEYVERAQVEARNRITRIQFCWYQFSQFPQLVDVYVNIQHVDIRQNGKC